MITRVAIAAVLVLAVLLPALGTAGVGTATPAAPRIVAVVPNPTLPEDRGETVELALPPDTPLAGLAIADGETVAALPDGTAGGRVVLTTAPAVVRNRTDRRVIGLLGDLALANAGETIELRRGRTVLDTVTYTSAPEGERLARTPNGWAWRPVGATARPVVRAGPAPARLFVLPDGAAEPVAALRAAEERILLAGYTFASARATRALCAAVDRGVRVAVLVEAGPVGGITAASAARLDALVACGATVAAVGARDARYAFHHPKYAVVDDRALVTTENWKPSGTGGRSNRGWGVLVESPETAAALAATFRADAAWRGTVPWTRVRENRSLTTAGAANGSYPSRFAPASVRVERVEVLVAPDNAETALVEHLDTARDSILIQQVAIGSRGQPFVRAAVRAARRGVRVRVLLSGAEYVRSDNRALVERLTALARREGLPLRARLVEPRSRFGVVHTKAVVIDRERTVVGSINWNNHSIRENREVALVLHGDEAARYYARVFRADWRGGVWRLPVGLLLALGPALAVAGWRGARFRFGPAP